MRRRLFCIRRLRFDYGEHHVNFLAKLRTDVYHSNMACTAAKLWQNAFQTIPNISFFDAENIFLAKFFDENFRKTKKIVGKSTNCLFLRSYGFLDVIGRCALKNDPRSFDFPLSTIFGRGMKGYTQFLVMTFG